LLALSYADRGFETIKTKVGGRELKHDIDMLKAIRHNHPKCALILDANGGYCATDALELLKQLHGAVVPP
jgi:L-alanine-DL-glutamate epimerase-like enolase superfamily enzyme